MAQIVEKFRQIPELANQAGIADAARILEDVIKQLQLETENRAKQAAYQFEQMLRPEANNRPNPAAAIVAVNSETKVEIDTEVELKVPVGEKEFTFTPVYNSTVYPVSLRYSGAEEEVYDLSGEGLPQKIILSQTLPQGLFLLGLEERATCNTLEGMQLLFQDVNKDTLIQLAWAKLHFKDQVYRLVYADYPESGQELAHTACDKEYLLLNRKRRNIAKATAELGLFRLEEVVDSCGLDSFIPVSDGRALTSKEGAVEWAQLVLPAAVDTTNLTKARITLNALPIFNAFSSIKDENLEAGNFDSDKIITIPVPDDEIFLGLGRVWTHTELPYLPRMLFPDRTSTFELGVRNPAYLAALDIPGLIQTLLNTINSTNPSALVSLSRDNRDVLQPYQQSLQTISVGWQEISAGLQQIVHDTYYLTLYPPRNARVVYVEVWRTNTALGGTLLPTNLELKHNIPRNCNIQVLVPPDQIEYGEPHQDADLMWRLREFFPNLSSMES